TGAADGVLIQSVAHDPRLGGDRRFWGHGLFEKSPSEGQARQKSVRKRSLRVVNEHSERIFNAA
ncbi:hypothetical protein, partial [Pseudomonas sp. PS02302]|uniref:hypothetical protein n=1 Tax=Pseudomonas sp. PS02302 TaxID=2991428 RepID=UPI00249BEF78